MAEPPHEPDSGYRQRWSEHNALRRELILRSAAQLIEESEPGAPISVQRIADRAGLVKSVVYRQFKSKDDLVRGVRGFVVNELAAELEADLDIASGSLRGILRAAIASAATWMEANPRLVDIIRAGPSDTAPDAPDAVAELRQRVVTRGDQIVATAAQATGTPAAAFVNVPFALFVMVEGALSSWARGEAVAGGQSRDELVESLTGITLLVIDGAARESGLAIDPDTGLGETIARLQALRLSGDQSGTIIPNVVHLTGRVR